MSLTKFISILTQIKYNNNNKQSRSHKKKINIKNKESPFNPVTL